MSNPSPSPFSSSSDEPILTPASTPATPPPAPDLEAAATVTKPHAPILRLDIRDLNHPGAAVFLSSTNPVETLQKGVRDVLHHLYASPRDPPRIRSVALILRDIPGVAYTTSSDLGSDLKEVHFSLVYIARIPRERRAHEIAGVVTHELVHCYQHNGRGTCPGGLIEGVADWVRLRCGLAPPHWRRETRDKTWDSGYQTTAYFLEYLELWFGRGSVQRINMKLKKEEYDEERFWPELFSLSVAELWAQYCEAVEGEEGIAAEGSA